MPRGREDMSEIQRARMLKAASDTIAEVGYARFTVAEVIGRARVSRKTFYEAFANRDDCFLALFEETLKLAIAVTGGAYDDERPWRVRTRAALAGLLAMMEREPALAKFWVVELRKGGENVLERRAQVLDQLADLIDQGRSEYKGDFGPPGVVAEGVVGGVVEVLHARVTSPSKEPLMNLLGPLMYMIVLPYLGRRAARSELNARVPSACPAATASVQVNGEDPLDGLKIRLTQRTALVLAAIGWFPGASNTKIAEVSGIVDHGQISKMLQRLARLELIENHGLGYEYGAANSWYLTERGEEVASATQARAYALV